MVWQGRYSELFIGGRWTAPESGDTRTVVSPVSEEAIAEIPLASTADVDHAVAAARKAFDQGPWPRMTLPERAGIVRRLRDLLVDNREQIATLITTEMGCPITQTLAGQAGAAQLLLDTYLDLAPQYPWRVVRTSTLGNALVTREAIGVVAAIVPWNAPLSVAMLKLGPALLAGCTVILKPSPEATLDSYMLTELMQEAGFPAGVINLVPADRAESEYLVSHAGVDKVSFTGSTAAGKRIASVCGLDLRRVTLELGGKSAAVVLDDADLDHVVANVKAQSLRYNGQACTNKARILVSPARQDELLERLVAMVDDLVVGDPTDPRTELGPLVSRVQRERVEGYVESGRDQGARLIRGGGRPADQPTGWFVEPTLFADVTSGMTIAQEEIFGPVLTVMTYDDVDQAVTIANDTDYGLSGSVFSQDLGRAMSVARRIRSGSVEVNGASAGFMAPLGGMKCSGIGREAGIEAFDAFVELKSHGIPAEFVPVVAAEEA